MATTKLEIMTPEDMFFEGDVAILQVELSAGSEGYMPGHVWCRKLLRDPGKLKVTFPDGSERTAKLHGGFVEIRDNFTVFTESIEWV